MLWYITTTVSTLAFLYHYHHVVVTTVNAMHGYVLCGGAKRMIFQVWVHESCHA